VQISKSSYADSIKVNASLFENCRANLFDLTGETANKGLYGVEKMIITKSQFAQHKGSILALYRGGNDESTMGPQLLFSHNEARFLQHAAPLVYLYGVQASLLEKNTWLEANPNGVVVYYEDKVNAVHRYKNNLSKNAGVVQANQFMAN
jgi:poly(beta-D-mannuronate) lyase